MDIWSKGKRSEVMRKIRSKNTKPEVTLRKSLFAKGYRYKIHDKILPGKPDIVFPKYKLAVFVHGCFWHFHQDCSEGKIPKSNSEFWQEKLVKNVERDKKHEADLVLKGWTVIVVWECEIERHLDNIILELEKQFALNNF
jgi:DNA mismatch endonuclease (patch repair protein)